MNRLLEIFGAVAAGLYRNPLSLWGYTVFRRVSLVCRNPGKRLRIGYLSNARRCRFGVCNALYDNVFLDDVSLGDYSYVASRTIIRHAEIGKFCCIGPHVQIGLGTHPTSNFVSVHPAFYSPRRQAQISFVDRLRFPEYSTVRIGNDVWIGANSIILDGVSVGDGAVIGAGALVTKDVPDYSVAVGVPARTVRQRFNDDQIRSLKSFRWWDRGLEWIREHSKEFEDVEEFLAGAESLRSRDRGA